MKKISTKFKKYLSDIAKTKTTPHEIALGFSVGTIIAILPTPGFSVLLGVLVILLYKKINKYALFGAIALFNPIFQIPLIYLSYFIGDLVFGSEPIIRFDIVILDQIYNFTRRYLVGNAIVAFTTGFISYFIVKYIAKKYHKNI